MQHTFLAFAALAASVSAQSITDLPSCATQCFINAASNSSTCNLADTLCQCTTGRQEVTLSVYQCLCGSTCSTSDLAKVQQVSNAICSSAVSAAGSTYTPTTLDNFQCSSTGGAAGGTSGTSTGMSTSGDMTSSDSSGTMTSMTQTTDTPTDSAAQTSSTGGASHDDMLWKAAAAIAGMVAAAV